MATAQRTRAVGGPPCHAAWQLKSALRHSVSAAYYNFLHFFTIIAGGVPKLEGGHGGIYPLE